MVPAQILELVDNLYVQTFENLVEWQAAVDENSVQTSFPAESIAISNVRNQYSFALIDLFGETVFRTVEGDFEERQTEAHAKLARLYNLARSKALGIDKIIDRLNKDILSRKKS
jgi:hypothetical protein